MRMVLGKCVLYCCVMCGSTICATSTADPIVDSIVDPICCCFLLFFASIRHGVGHCSVVHEGPHGIGTKKRNFDEALQVGMVTSIEPGYYAYEDGFGFRIENLACVVPFVPVEGGDHGGSGSNRSGHGSGGGGGGGTEYMTFMNLTMCPIETKLIDVSLMNQKQIDWLNNYHCDVKEALTPLLQQEPKVLEWLIRKTQPLPLANSRM